MLEFIKYNYKILLFIIVVILLIVIIIIIKRKYTLKITYRVFYKENYEEELNKEYHEKKLKELKKQILKENEDFKKKQSENIQETQGIIGINFEIPIGKWTKLIFGEKINNLQAIKSLIKRSMKNNKKVGLWQIKIEANKQISPGKHKGRGR